jgi:hypothetical protein
MNGRDGSGRAAAGNLWDVAGIRRACKAWADRRAGKPVCGYTPALPRSDKHVAAALPGTGLAWAENGRALKAQVWSPGPRPRSYWLKVQEPGAHFPGEMRLAYADADGTLSLDGKIYSARGSSRIHRSDGSDCYGGHIGDGGRWQPCARCLAGQVRELTGRFVRVAVPGDPMYGQALRWGTLREVTGDVAVFDGYCDCNGIREYSGGSYSGNGVRVPLASIREITAVDRTGAWS